MLAEAASRCDGTRRSALLQGTSATLGPRAYIRRYPRASRLTLLIVLPLIRLQPRENHIPRDDGDVNSTDVNSFPILQTPDSMNLSAPSCLGNGCNTDAGGALPACTLGCDCPSAPRPSVRFELVRQAGWFPASFIICGWSVKFHCLVCDRGVSCSCCRGRWCLFALVASRCHAATAAGADRVQRVPEDHNATRRANIRRMTRRGRGPSYSFAGAGQ